MRIQKLITARKEKIKSRRLLVQIYDDWVRRAQSVRFIQSHAG
jgi:hypothetical protein